jgi:hypothetical protein
MRLFTVYHGYVVSCASAVAVLMHYSAMSYIRPPVKPVLDTALVRLRHSQVDSDIVCVRNTNPAADMHFAAYYRFNKTTQYLFIHWHYYRPLFSGTKRMDLRTIKATGSYLRGSRFESSVYTSYPELDISWFYPSF